MEPLTTDVSDPVGLLAAIDAGAPLRPEVEAIERLVADACASGDRSAHAAARRGLLVVRGVRKRAGQSTARVDALLAEVRALSGACPASPSRRRAAP